MSRMRRVPTRETAAAGPAKVQLLPLKSLPTTVKNHLQVG